MSTFTNNLSTSKVAAIVVGVVLLAGAAFALPAKAQTVESLTAQINSLLATIASLQSQLAAMGGGSGMGAGVCPAQWNTNLQTGSTGADVMKLQKFLNSDAATKVADSGAGSPGMESEYYGAKTAAAVSKFQEKYAADILTPLGLTAGTGKFFASSRAKANMLCATASSSSSSSSGGVVVPVGTGLSVSSGSQPANSLAPENASRVPFTKFMVTAGNDGDVVLNSVTVKKVGLINKTAFDGIVLLDENGIQVGTAKTLNSNDEATIGEKVTIPRGTTKMFTVAANMDSDLDSENGQVGGMNVVAVNTSATVTGSLPIAGAMHTVNSTLAVGTATADESTFDPDTSRSKEVGTSNYIFAGVKITAGSAEDVRLRSIRWNQTGSISGNELGNLMVVVDGTSYPVMISADGDYFSASFGNGIVIEEGFSKDVYIKGDIVGTNAAGRTVMFDLEEATDVYLTGEEFGYGVTPTAGTTGTASDSTSEFTSGTPFFDGSKVTVTAGSVSTVSRSNAVPAQNVAVNVTNQPLGGFDIDLKGEAISVQSMVFEFATTTGAQTSDGWLTNVTLVNENGAVVAGPADSSTTFSGGRTSVTFSDTVTFPLGKHTYTLKGKVPSQWGNNMTVQASTTPAAWTNVKGDVTGDTITLSQGSFTMNTMTVKAAALTVSVGSTPSAQNIVAGVQDYLFANYIFDASASGEDVRFSTIPLLPTGAGGFVASYLTGCQLFDGSTALNTGTNVVDSPTVDGSTNATFTLDDQFVVTKGTIKTLTLKCDVSGSASGTIKWGIGAVASSFTVTGVTSSNSVSETINSSTGQLQTIASGSFTVAKDSSSPSYAVAAAGSTDVTLGVLKLRATNEELKLRQLALQLTGPTASSTDAVFVNGTVKIYDGAQLVGTAVFNSSGRYATSTLTTQVTLPKDTDKVLTLKADLSGVGSSEPGIQGALVKVDYDGSNAADTEAIGSGSSTVDSSSTTDTAVDGVRVFRTYPRLAKLSVPTTNLVNGTNKLYRFSVTADSKGDLSLYKFSFTMSTTTVSAASLQVYGFTDSGFSQTVSGYGSDGALRSAAVAPTATLAEYVITNTGGTETPLVIPAGATRYFEVRATITGGDGDGDSIQIQLDGDADFPSLAALMASATSVDSDANDDFIWSPNATTTSGVTANDWTNGYGLPGLPSSNMDAEVLSN